MADRYWVGGTGNWSDNTNHWSATDGGGAGASKPTSADNVFFTANSFSGAGQVVTVNEASNCLNMDWTGATNTPTLAYGNFTLNCYGNRTYIAAMVITCGTGGISYRATSGTKVLTQNGVSSPANQIFNGSGGTFRLADALTITGTGNMTLTAGTFDVNTKAVNLNGTAHTITGNFTFAVLTRNGTATKTDTVTFGAGSTITCTTFAMIGNSATNRLLVQSSIIGSAFTVTATNWTGTVNVDIVDCTATNAIDLSAITGLSGNCGGNTNITFTIAAAQTSAGAGNWSGAVWGAGRVPLPQDDVSVGHNVTADMPRIGASITITTGTTTLGLEVSVYGSFTKADGATLSGSFTIFYRGRGAFNLSTLTTPGSVAVYMPGGTLTITKSMTNLNGYFQHWYGTLDFNDFNVVVNTYYASWGSGTRVTNMGSGTLTCNRNTAGSCFEITGSNYTFNAETSTIVLSNTSTNGTTFAGAGQTFNNVTVQGTGAYALTITGSNTFNTLTIDRSAAAKTIAFTDGTTQTVTNFVCAVSGTTVVTLTGTAAAGWTITKAGGGIISLDYLAISYSTASPALTWYAGEHSYISAGTVSGWIFGAPGRYNNFFVPMWPNLIGQ